MIAVLKVVSGMLIPIGGLVRSSTNPSSGTGLGEGVGLGLGDGFGVGLADGQGIAVIVVEFTRRQHSS